MRYKSFESQLEDFEGRLVEELLRVHAAEYFAVGLVLEHAFHDEASDVGAVDGAADALVLREHALAGGGLRFETARADDDERHPLLRRQRLQPMGFRMYERGQGSRLMAESFGIWDLGFGVWSLGSRVR